VRKHNISYVVAVVLVLASGGIAVPAVASDCTWTNGEASAAVTVRKSTNASSAKVVTIPAGKSFSFEKCPAIGWVQVRYGNYSGWARNENLPRSTATRRMDQGCFSEGEWVEAVANLAIREYPGSEYAKMGTLTKGSTIEIIERTCASGPSPGWVYVMTENHGGWLNAHYLISIPPKKSRTSNEIDGRICCVSSEWAY